ncbi:NACHT domain-containing protein [Streptomyces endophyticus]|uniref:HNH endonuclease n=1 Tax=Streptomyces endophyticus TaxID=714166 RepID=A0ABU6FBT2_9ACTN|nr:HNH endonuclease [Streptomyces endophyticus]MEB8341299.1 hypothetical protein [Streptomyces endophyticus]
MAIRDVDRKLLWGRSWNECAFPGCSQELTVDLDAETTPQKTVVLGEEAHIVAREDEGPRGDPGVPLADRNAYDNLILLCPTHHTLIDKDHGRNFPVDALLAMKHAHEAAVVRRGVVRGVTENEPTRREALLADLSTSRGRLVSRWIAVGLDPEQAEELADDSTVGVCPEFMQFHAERRFTVLTGDFGSGKTVALEREYQASALRALDNPDEPLPVHLSAKSTGSDFLRALDEQTARFPSAHSKVTLFLDGLDEFGAGRSAELVDDLQAWLYSAPGRKVLATSRPDANLRANDCLTLPALSDTELNDLLERVGAPRDLAWHPNSEIRDALHRPLFALIAADCRKAGSQVPYSRGSFLAALVERALTRASGLGSDTYALLARLGRLTLDVGGGVPAGEVGTSEEQVRLVQTRLVVHRNRMFTFALPVLGQYFGGQYVLDNGLPELVQFSPQRRDRWRDALTFVVSSGSWERVTALLSDLTTVDPGLAAWITDQGVPSYEREPVAALPEALECARRLSVTLDAWLSGIGRAGTLLSCSDGTGRGVPIGVGSGAEISTGLHVVFAAPKDFDGSERFFEVSGAADMDRGEVDGVRITSFHSVNMLPDMPAWPWRLTLSWVKTSMKALLERRAFVLPGNLAACQERAWSLSRLLTGQSGHLGHRPIPLTDVVSSIDEIFRLAPNAGRVQFQRNTMALRTELVELRDQCAEKRLPTMRDGKIHRPYPVPDRPPHEPSRAISSLYSREVLTDLVRHVYSDALSIYEDIVTEYLSPVQRTLQLGGALPVRFECKISWPPVGDGRRLDIGPRFSRTVLPLPSGSASQVDVTQVEDVSAESDYWPEWVGSDEVDFRRIRPKSAAWSGRSVAHETLWVFKDTPATNLAYNWLSQDISAVGLSGSVRPLVD